MVCLLPSTEIPWLPANSILATSLAEPHYYDTWVLIHITLPSFIPLPYHTDVPTMPYGSVYSLPAVRLEAYHAPFSVLLLWPLLPITQKLAR